MPASSSTASLTGLASGTSYTFKAYSDLSCGTTLTSDVNDATLLTKPGQVTGVSVTVTDEVLSLSWTAVTGAESYKVQWKSGNLEYTDTNQSTSPSASDAIGGLSNGTEYTLRVAATNTTGDGAWSADATGTPAEPTLTTGEVTHNSLRLTIANHSDNWSYESTTTPEVSCTGPISGTAVTVTGLASEATYTFKAYQGHVCTVPKLLATAAPVTTSAAPTLTAGNATTSSLKLTIANHSGDWYYKHTSPTGGTCSSTVSGTTAIATGLSPGTLYTFTAYSDSGCNMVLATATATDTLEVAELSTSSVEATTATLTIANYTAAWRYKYTKPTTPAGTCSSVVAAGTATASLASLAGNTSYTFKAYSDSSCSAEVTSDTTDADFLTKPAKPSRPTVTAGTGSGKLTLTATLTGGDTDLSRWEYKLKEGSGNYGSWTSITTDTDNELSYVFSDLDDGTNYTFKVRAVNSTGTGTASDASVAVAPSDETLSASSINHNSATLNIANYSGSWYYKYTSPTGGSCSSTAVTGTTANLTGLVGNTSYTYKAYSDSGCATELTSTSTDADFLTQPAQSSKPSISVGSGKLTISSSISGGSGALSKWQYTTDDGTNWKDISTTSTTLSHTVTGLTDGTSYTFKVRAVNSTGSGVSGGGTGPESAASAATAPQTATLAANNVMATTATLAITDYSGNWYYKRTAPNPSAGTCVAVTGIGTPDARLSDLSPGTSYTFKAYSDNTCDTELTSDATDAEFLTRPGQVSGVTVIASNRSLKVSWTAPSGTVTGYTVQWKSGSGEYDTTNQATSTGTSYTISGLTNDTQYTLRVAAKNTTGDGAWSDDATGTPDTNVTLTPSDVTDTSLKLTITNHSGTWYYKYISPDDPNNCTPVSSTTTVVTGLAANTSYTYTAYSDSGCSTELATATAVKTLLAQVTGVEVVPRDASLSVTWDRPRSGSPNYEVQWKSGNQDWDSANRQNTAQNYFTQIPSLSNAVEYTVRVRRITTSPSAVGEWSEPVKGTPAEVALTTRSVGATTATLVITNYANSAGDVWSYKRTAPTTAPARTA